MKEKKTVREPRRTNEKKKLNYTVGSGNVFADLDLPNPEERLLKARLASLIYDAIEHRGWTQVYTAEVLGISQPDVSDISRGRLKNFSVERLLYFLSKLEHRVTIRVENQKDKLPAKEIVIAAQKVAKEVVQVR
jgi:predicted XRE-type DNA-binding protein